MEKTRVKIHPTVASAALKQKRDREYRIWVLARSLDGPGSGYALISDLQKLIRREGIKGLSSSTLRKLLKKGYDSFWTIYKDKLYYKSLYNICHELGISKLVRSPAKCEYKQIRTLKEFRSVCYASRFPAGDSFSAPISRRTLKNLNGRSNRTQRSYDKVAGVERRGNLKATGIIWKKGDTDIPEGFTIDYVGDKLHLFRYMPNSYRVPTLKKAPRGMMRRVNQRLRADLLCKGEERSDREKLYFASYKRAHKRIESAEDGDYFYVRQNNVSWPDEPGEPTVTCKTSRGGQAIWSEAQVFSEKHIIFS